MANKDKKFKLHKLTNKEMQKMADMYGLPADEFNNDCYCLVDKKGKLFTLDGNICVYKAIAPGRTDAESTVKRAFEAAIMFKNFAIREEEKFKIPDGEELYTSKFKTKKIKYSDKDAILVKAPEHLFSDQDFVAIMMGIQRTFDSMSAMKDVCKELASGAAIFPEEIELDENDYWKDECEEEEILDYDDSSNTKFPEADDDFDDLDNDDPEYGE